MSEVLKKPKLNPYLDLLDPVIAPKLQKHQVVAFEFIMRRFFPLLDPDYSLPQPTEEENSNNKENNNIVSRDNIEVKKENEKKKKKQVNKKNKKDNDDDDQEESFSLVSTDPTLQTGAILGDDMGTGKVRKLLNIITL